MRPIVSLLCATAALVGTAGAAQAQSYSPSRTYANPSEADTQAARNRGPCKDPWVTMAMEVVYGRADPWACSPANYVGGRWNSYNQLVHDVKAKGFGNYRFMPQRLDGAGPLAGRVALQALQGASIVAAGGGNIVAAGGGNLTASGVAQIVAAGGGNIVASGGGNIVAAGGGNIVAAGGGNLINIAGNRLVSPGGGNYSLQSVGTRAPVIGGN